MLTNLLLSFMAAISPGPNIVLVIQNSLVFGRKYGIMTALGVVTGVFFWLLCLTLGFTIILKNPKVLYTFNLFAAFYLLYIASLIMRLKIKNGESEMHKNSKFFAESLVITLFNPEIAIFYGSILAGIASSEENLSSSLMMTYLACFMAIEAFVFLSAAYFVAYINKFIRGYIFWIKLVAAASITYFSIKIFLKVIKDYSIIFGGY